MALTETTFQIRLTKAEKSALFRLAGRRSLESGERVSAAKVLKDMVAEALEQEKELVKAELADELTNRQLEAMR